jgi:flagellar biosynthesis/type III secretory pathway M-ring protein FliF/YscJ
MAGQYDNTTATTTTPSQQQEQPFYKKKWFIVFAIGAALIGIAFIFILLFPVVRAIVQTIVKKSTLDVQRATITQPQNNR